MDIIVEGKRYRLDQSQTLGVGGEGTVLKADINGTVAVKIYHEPSPIRERKLRAFLGKQWDLPAQRVASPISLVMSAIDNSVIGLTMPYLGTGFEELTSLANKKYRATFGINSRNVVDIFRDGVKTLKLLHGKGLMVGDLNDLNVLFRGQEMLFIDVDTWQFDQFPCMRGSEKFLSPELYGIDLSLQPVFKPRHDIYSLWVLLFKSLYLTHPYGGVHAGLKQITQRAQARVSVYNNDVKYPTIALPLDTFGENDLTIAFHQVFEEGKAITLEDTSMLLDDFATRLDADGNYIAKPIMPVIKPVVPTYATNGVKLDELFQYTGQLVESFVHGNTVYVVSYESGKAWLYKYKPNPQPQRLELFNQPTGARYQMQGESLFINLAGSTKVMVLDTSGMQVRPVMSFDTDMFLGNRRAIFRTTDQNYYRVVNGVMMRGRVNPQSKDLDERIVRNVMRNQTWFAAQTIATGDRMIDALCGFSQVFNQQLFWLVYGSESFDFTLQALATDEALIDLSVKFSSAGLLVRRHTHQRGVDYLHAQLLNYKGETTFVAPRVRAEDAPSGLHGQAFAGSVLLHATDRGLVQEKVREQSLKSFDATRGLVSTGDKLHIYQKGLVVVKEGSVIYIQLN